MNTRNDLQTYLTMRVLWFCFAICACSSPAPALCQTVISCGQTISATTTTPAQNDQYSYFGTTGERLLIAIWGPIGCNSDYMVADVYGPNGQMLTNLASGCNAGRALALTLPTTGTYTILVHESLYRAVAAYSLGIQSLTSGGCAGQPLACGQTVKGNTTSNTQIDSYSYVGTAGDRVSVALWGPIGCNSDYMVADIYGPNGQVVTNIASGCNSGGALALTLPTTGTYTILVRESLYRAIANYSLSVQSRTGGGCGSRPIACGQTVTTNTTANSQMDAYSYAGVAGDRLSIALWGPIGCNSDYMVADIYGPSGQVVTNVASGCNSGGAVALTLPSSGVYTILIRESLYRAVANYSLSVQSRTGGGCDGRTIVCGQTLNGNTSANSQMDTYRYTGTIGETLAVALWGPIGCNSDYMVADIYGPNGVLLTNLASGCNVGSAIALTLPSTGAYTILVRESLYRAVANYSLSVQSRIGGGCNGRPITCGQTVNTNTTSNSQMDSYAYVGTAGERLTIGMWGPIGCNSDYMIADVYSPNGQWATNIASRCNVGNSVELTLLQTGIYTILVHESYYRATGNYGLSIQSRTGGGCGGRAIACSQTVSNTLGKRAEIQSYGFGTGGGMVIFSFGGFTGAQFELYNSSGSKLFTRSAGSSTNVSLAGGTYTLLVHDDNFSDTGTYSFAANCIPSGCNYLISPTIAAVPFGGTTGVVSVLAAPDCNWTGTANGNWLGIVAGGGGSGNGAVTYKVDANASTNARASYFTIANFTFVVNQAGAPIPQTPVYTPYPTTGGSFQISNDVVSISGSGEDIQGTADTFYFLSRQWVGDGQIVARVTSLVGTNDPAAEVGVMIRETLSEGAKHAFLRIDTKTNLVFRRRLAGDGYSVETEGAITNRTWLRLMRIGDTFIAHCSTNGTDWEYVWFTTVNMSSRVNIGLAITARHNNSYATATLDNIAITPPQPLSGTWPLSAPRILLGGEFGGRSEIQRVGGFKMLVGGAVGDVYSIVATNLVTAPSSSWPLLGNVTNTYGVALFVDDRPLENAARYYRARKP